MEERELLTRAQNGDEAALNQLLEAVYPKIKKTARIYLKNESDADDAAQETCIKIINNIQTVTGNFDGWVSVIARNTAKSRYEKAYVKHDVEFSALENEEDELEFDPVDERAMYRPDIQMDNKAREDIIREVLEHLTENQRVVVAMRYYDGLSIREIAEQLEIPVTAADRRLRKANAKIRDEVSELQKRDGIKLYNMAPLPYFVWLLLGYKATPQIYPETTDVVSGSIRKAFDKDGAKAAVRAAEENTVRNSAGSAAEKGAQTVVKTAAKTEAYRTAATSAAGAAAHSTAVAAGAGLGTKIAVGALAVVVGATAAITDVRGKITEFILDRKEEPVAAASDNKTENDEQPSKTSDAAEAPDDLKTEEIGSGTDASENAKAIWAVEPGIALDRVYELKAMTEVELLWGDGIYIENLGNSPEWDVPEIREAVRENYIASGHTYEADRIPPTYTGNAIAVEKNGMFHIMDYSGNDLFPTEYGRIQVQRYRDEDPVSVIPFSYFPANVGFLVSEGSGIIYQFNGTFTEIREFYKPGIGITGTYYEIYSQDHIIQYVEKLEGTQTIVSRNVPDGDPFYGHRFLLTARDGAGNIVGYDLYDEARNFLRGIYPSELYIPIDYSENKISSIWTVSPFTNGFISVTNGSKITFINAETGAEITDYLYDDVKWFENGYCPVKKGDKWGFIDETGKEVTDFIWDDASALFEGKAYVGINGQYGILDLKQTTEQNIPVTYETCYNSAALSKE